MSDVIKALGDVSRRELLDALRQQDGQSLGDLSNVLPSMTRYGVSAHLAVLERAGLVVSVRAGRRKLHYLNAVPIVELSRRWLSEYTESTASRLIALRNHLEETTMSQPAANSPDVIFVIHIRASRTRVWDELTSTNTPRAWQYDAETRSTWEVGARYDQSLDGFVLITGEILVFDPPTHLRLTFDPRWDDTVAPEQPGVLDYTLEEITGDEPTTKLTVTVSGLTGESRYSAQRDTSQIYSSLKSMLETGRTL